MTRLLIDLPEDLDAKLRARATAAGYADAEEYVRAMITADVDELGDDPNVPAHLSFESTSELETRLLEGINSGPAVEMTQEDWEKLSQGLQERHSRGGTT